LLAAARPFLWWACREGYFTRNLVAILGELRAGLEVLDRLAVHKFSLTAPAGG
jgi:hypothetical protein